LKLCSEITAPTWRNFIDTDQPIREKKHQHIPVSRR
jgi:hypothetical protein